MRLLALPLMLAAVAQAAETPDSRAFPEPPKPSERVFAAGRPTSAQGPTFNASKRDREHAKKLMTQYDTDGNRVIDGDEWKQVGKQTKKADRNGDNRITIDELIAHASGGAKARKTHARSFGTANQQSLRLTTPTETLPKGLPQWFRQKDENGDGQVAMHEYAKRWSKSTTRKFEGLDKNDDGLITPDEAAR